jgi:glycosyltransferase involved in cell wall biosynthesis
MKILYQHRTLADGAEGIHIAEIVEAFERLGHEVIMLALATSHARGEGRPNRWGRLKAALPPALFELGAVVCNAVDYLNLQCALGRHKPDLVYKRHAMYDAGIVLACQRAGVPIVLEVNCPYSSAQHSRFEQVTFPRLARLLERLAFRRASLVATVSSPLGALIKEIGGRDLPVVVIPNGANPERFAPRPTPPHIRARLAPDSTTLIGWAGILRPWHRVDLLLEAVSKLNGVRVAVIGDGPDRPRLERVAATLGVADRVRFTGRIVHADMPDYIAALDIAVAVDDRTGYASPMKLLEYMAMGKPIVAPRMPNIEDFVSHGVDGLLFTPGDSTALAQALEQLAKDPALMRLFGSNARRKVELERNWIAIARRVLAQVGAADTRNVPAPMAS